jgi:hypothetical protein
LFLVSPLLRLGCLKDTVVGVAQEEHQGMLVAFRLHREHGLVALFPACQELGNHLRRVLQVRGEQYARVAARLEQAVVGRAQVPEVAGVQYELHVPVARRDSPQLADRAVGGAVVDADVLVVEGLRGHDLRDARAQLLDVFLLVVAGRDDADELTHC